MNTRADSFIKAADYLVLHPNVLYAQPLLFDWATECGYRILNFHGWDCGKWHFATALAVDETRIEHDDYIKHNTVKWRDEGDDEAR